MSAVSRRSFLRAGLAAGAALAAGGGTVRRAFADGPGTGLPPELIGVRNLDAALLPTAAQAYADNATMVGFGPRVTGSTAHNDFLAWLKQEFANAGCQILPDVAYPCFLWEAKSWGLEVLEGIQAGPVPVASYYPRGGETPEGGVVGKLIYAGRAPQPSFSGDITDVVDLKAAIDRAQREFADWLAATIAGLGAAANGAVLLVEPASAPPLNVAAIFAIVGAYFTQFPGGGWATRPYKKNWLVNLVRTPGANTAGAAGIVYIVDGSFDALAGNYAPFGAGYVGMPALYVDRDTGARLRALAQSQPNVRFTMSATKANTTSPSITAVLPGDGSTDEVMIGNTHSDGTNFAEENGTLGLLELARYFHGLKLKGKGLRRDLVFSCVTGHFNSGFPQTQGFIDSHPELIARATHALTIEHLGCTEWFDDSRGYYTTGLPEPATLYHDESLTPVCLDSFASTNLVNHSLSRSKGNLYFGVGGALQSAGIPSMSYIAGPTYLVANGPTQGDGVLDKLDPALQVRQVAWFADMLTRLDGMPSGRA